VWKTKDACAQFQIIICTIFIFLSLFLAVLSTFWLLFSPSFMLAICCCLAPLLYDPFISFLPFRVGPSTAVSKTNGPSFSDFDPFPLIFASYLTCMAFSLFYATTPPYSCSLRVQTQLPFSYDLPSCCNRPPLSSRPWLLLFLDFGYRII